MRYESWARATGVLMIGVGVTVAFFLTRREASATDEVRLREPGAPVAVLRVEPTTRRESHVAHGVVRPVERAMLSFVEGGRLVSRPVEVGDRVVAGQILAQLDPAAYRNAVRANSASRRELELRRAQLARDRDRAARLARDGVSTTVRLEQATSGLDRVDALHDATRAQVSESRRRAREATLRAPFSGLVTDVLAERGELVGAGQPVLRLAGDGGREVLVEVPFELAQHLAPGEPVQLAAMGVEADDPLASTPLVGSIRRVAGDASSLSGLYPVTIDVEGDVRAGLGVQVELLGPARDAIRIPLGAVLDPSGRRPFVWTVTDGRAERAWLRLGRLGDGGVEVRDGLEAGDEVVVRGHLHLLEGEAVERAGDAS